MRLGLTGKYLLALAIGVVFLVTVVIAGWRVQRDAYRELATLSAQSMQAQGQQELERRGQSIATLLADALTNPVYFVDLPAIGQIAHSTLRQPDVRYVTVFDAQGRVLHDGSDHIDSFGRPMRDPFALEAIGADALLVQSNDELIDVTQPMFLGTDRIGGVRVGLSRAESAQAIAAAKTRLAQAAREMVGARLRAQGIPLIGLGLLALGVCWMVLRGLVRPIRLLADHARALERGDHELDVDSGRHDEIGELMRAFGHMSRSIATHDRDVRKLAYLDTLTGLPNRLMLRESLSRALLLAQANGSSVALLFIDLDDFKRINDTLGHDAGDEALAQLSARLEGCLDAVGAPPGGAPPPIPATSSRVSVATSSSRWWAATRRAIARAPSPSASSRCCASRSRPRAARCT